MEAMACNLSVVTTPFPGLVTDFQEGQGLTFVEQPDREMILSEVLANLSASSPPGTRKMVRGYDWQAIAGKLRRYYQGLFVT